MRPVRLVSRMRVPRPDPGRCLSRGSSRAAHRHQVEPVLACWELEDLLGPSVVEGPDDHGAQSEGHGLQVDVLTGMAGFHVDVSSPHDHQVMLVRGIAVDARRQPQDPAGDRVQFQRIGGTSGRRRAIAFPRGRDALGCPQQLRDVRQGEGGIPVLSDRSPERQGPLDGDVAIESGRGQANALRSRWTRVGCSAGREPHAQGAQPYPDHYRAERDDASPVHRYHTPSFWPADPPAFGPLGTTFLTVRRRPCRSSPPTYSRWTRHGGSNGHSSQ
jgi:hypothetical protein